MEYIHAVILGVVQGIAEFLPISSSGHLVIADAALREYSGSSVPAETATMGIALHFGTLLSILVVYRKELPAVLLNRHLLMLIVIATIPVGVVGVLFADYVEQVFQTPLLAGVALLVTAGFLVAGHALQKPDSTDGEASVATAVVIGIFQAIAVIPGISRSGSTIAAGMFCGLSREQAARFSFLIAIPAISGAAVMQLKKVLTGEEPFSGDPYAIALGTIIAFAVGVFALRWLLKLVVADRLYIFAVYCVLVGCMTIAWQLLR